jgi:hypothetical protein
LGGQFQGQAKPLIQLVLPEQRDWSGARFVPSADTVPNWGRIALLAVLTEIFTEVPSASRALHRQRPRKYTKEVRD